MGEEPEEATGASGPADALVELSLLIDWRGGDPMLQAAVLWLDVATVECGGVSCCEGFQERADSPPAFEFTRGGGYHPRRTSVLQVRAARELTGWRGADLAQVPSHCPAPLLVRSARSEVVCTDEGDASRLRAALHDAPVFPNPGPRTLALFSHPCPRT